MTQPRQAGPSAPANPGQQQWANHGPTFAPPVPPEAPTGHVPPLVQGTKAPGQLGQPQQQKAPTQPPGHAPAQAPGQPDARQQPPARHSDPNEAGSRGVRGRSRGPRRARLQLRHIDPWTVLKFACVLSIALFFVWLIVVGVLYGVLDGAGVIDKINDAVTSINANGGQPPIRAGIVFGAAAIIGVVNMVLFIALSTVGSVVYNLCADLVGGVEVTLSER